MKNKNTAVYIFLAIYIALVFVGGLHHEVWLDEARAWLLASHAPWLELAYEAKLESHPVLWYAILKMASIVSDQIYVLQIVSAAFGIFAFYLILKHSPFSNLQKALLLLNLYVLYEYTIVGRNYSIEMAALFSLVVMFPQRQTRPGLYLLLCAVLSQTHFYGFLFASVFAPLLFVGPVKPKAIFSSKTTYLGAAVFGMAAGACLWLLVRSPEQIDIGSAAELSLYNLTWKLNGVLSGFFPILNTEAPHIPTQGMSWVAHFASGVCIAWLIGLLVLIRKNIIALYVAVTMFGSFIALSLLRTFEFLPSRHLGQIGLIFLVVAWLVMQKRKERVFGLIFTFSLAAQAWGGARAFEKDFRGAFSNGKAAAQILSQLDYSNRSLVVDGSFYASSFTSYLRAPYYENANSSPVFYTRLTRSLIKDNVVTRVYYVGVLPNLKAEGFRHTEQGEIRKRLIHALCESQKPPLLITHYRNDFMSWPDVKLVEVAGLANAIRANEDFYIYDVQVESVEKLCER